jgi:hypothetical protein
VSYYYTHKGWARIVDAPNDVLERLCRTCRRWVFEAAYTELQWRGLRPPPLQPVGGIYGPPLPRGRRVDRQTHQKGDEL